jgi:hypothetical protein
MVESCVLAGADAFVGYPITPASLIYTYSGEQQDSDSYSERTNTMKTNTVLFSVVMALLAVALIACAGKTAGTASPPIATASETPPPVQSPTIIIPTPEPTNTQIPTAATTPQRSPTPITVAPESDKLVFAAFREAPVEALPAIYHEPIAPDLDNVVVPFALSAEQRVRLARDGVVVNPGVEKEFFTVYEQARYDNVPMFVTSDSLLHTYHLLFDKVLRTSEREVFIPMLRDLNQATLAATISQYQALQGTSWEDAALRTVAFVAVGSELMDSTVEMPPYVADLVTAELANIEAASGILPSPIFPGLDFGEDYTQYIARGHYTLSEELTSYFKSMMWYGRMTFRLKTRDIEVGRAETRSALLLIQALRTAQVNGKPALDTWLDLYNPTVFFVGRSDDLTAIQYLGVMDALYGPQASLIEIADDGRLDTFIEAANQLPPPRILGLVIGIDQDEVETTKGFRFMGQRFVTDAYIFRQLIYRNVGSDTRPRMLPNGLDVMAALGSERAYVLLDQMGETSYDKYPQQMAKMRDWVAGLTTEDWTETLYTTWLHTFQPLLEIPGEGSPQFMGSTAWLDKQINSSLGSWAELKHDTILYAKQVYAEMGAGGSGAPRPLLAQGYVEPVPAFFSRLEALTSMTIDGLDSRGLLNDQDRDSLQRLQQLAAAFQRMAEKELRGEPLTEAEFELIRFYGGELEHLTMAAADRDEEGGVPVMEEDPQAAVIADVATAPDPDLDGIPNPVVLEVAVGRINEIYVVVPLIIEDGAIRLQVAKGGVFSYYEFSWPADDRLTDEKWREMLDQGTAPALPEWTSEFLTTETESAELRRTIYGLQSGLSQAFWDLDASWPLYMASGDVQAQFQRELEALRTEKLFAGRQWIHASYRSFDRQADDRAVVTVRETWEDSLYSFREAPGDAETVGAPIGRRGPYTLDVTYSLTLTEGRWLITRVVFANEPPAWSQ